MIDYEKLKMAKDVLYANNIDDLIVKLRELARASSRYKIGDEVWYIDLPVNKVHCARILKVNYGEYVINGEINGTKDDFLEEDLYPSKQALIESQIKHWQSLIDIDVLEAIKEECQKCHDFKISYGIEKGCHCAAMLIEQACQHQADYSVTPNYNQHENGMVSCVEFKCKKCGEFYR